jgi:hypothetical protein
MARNANPLKAVDPSYREFNVALWRIGTGKIGPGGICCELAAITGLSPSAIRGRVTLANRKNPAAFQPGGVLTPDDRDYCGAVFHPEYSPEARDFLGGISGDQRRDPDHEDSRVSRQRIGGRLISISRGLPS